ncbi:Cyclopropane-fatty-acyl-phospholipid synthase [Termitomyces sp. J132]|nr:Cyclopropane-fatty-acyl-phospholipid synthase [Termitomyces sp. J132]
MSRITTGRLKVLTSSRIYSFPTVENQVEKSDVEFEAELRVINDAFWVRLCTMSDLGFAEAYMYGEVECDDLVSLFRIFLDNKENLSSLDSKLSYLFTLPQTLTSYRFLNTIGNSRSNVSAHYDISNEMFSGFLSRDMTYSCAIFKDLDGDIKDGPPISLDELHEAQIRKLKHIIQKAQICPGHRVLEIGSGWGSMAILIAQTIQDTHVDTITLSVQQQTLARERVAQAGLSDRVEVHLMDYRNMPPEWEGAFDRVISIEMIEAVGAEFLERYWEVVDWAMKRDSGVGVIQAITIPEARYDRYIKEIDFIRKWVVFPGGFLPTLTLLLQTMRTGSKGRLVVDSVSNIGPHYARTLREWRKRFLDRFESVIIPALKREFPDVMCGPTGMQEIEVFKRKWICKLSLVLLIAVLILRCIDYYCYCEVGFTTRTLGDHIVSFVREGYQDYGCNVME